LVECRLAQLTSVNQNENGALAEAPRPDDELTVAVVFAVKLFLKNKKADDWRVLQKKLMEDEKRQSWAAEDVVKLTKYPLELLACMGSAGTTALKTSMTSQVNVEQICAVYFAVCMLEKVCLTFHYGWEDDIHL
jgi:hypothetical protein